MTLALLDTTLDGGGFDMSSEYRGVQRAVLDEVERALGTVRAARESVRASLRAIRRASMGAVIVPPPGTTLTDVRPPPARARVALVHDDRFGRAGIARQLVRAGCDVTVVDSYLALERLDGIFLSVAVVYLRTRDVEVLVDGLVERYAAITFLALLDPPSRPAAEATLERCGAHRYEFAPHCARDVDVAAIARRLALS